MNELILLGSVVLIFGAVLLAYRLWDTAGLYGMTAIVTVLSNIEVLILVNAFGMEQTLGNVLFASTFLITDILSENAGRQAARKAVFIGLFVSAFFVLLSGSWLLYVPSENDWIMPAVRQIFRSTPRMVLASMCVYAISQLFDVWLYHRLWNATARKTGSRRRFLWLRNNAATMISQLVNTVLFNLAAFAGKEGYTPGLLVSIIVSGYVLYFFTSLLDTPIVYLARRIHDRRQAQQNLPE